MEESKEKIGIRKSLSRVASSFLLGKKGMNRSYFITKRREVDEDEEEEPHWMNKTVEDESTTTTTESDEVIEMKEINETPELNKSNNITEKYSKRELKRGTSVADMAHNLIEKPSFKTINLSTEEMKPFKGKGKGRRSEVEYIITSKEEISKEKPKLNIQKRNVPYFTITVTLLNIIFMIWAFVLSGGFDSPKQNPMLGPKIDVLVDMGGKWVPYILNNGEWWRLFTATYLHSGLVHIIFNILVQYKVGVRLEENNGAMRLMPIYILSGLSGNILSSLFSPTLVTVGASGAIYGFLGVLIVDLIKNWKKLEKPRKIYIVLMVNIIISLAIGLLPGIDNFAHIGGFIMGILSGIVFLPSMSIGKRSLKRRLLEVSITIPIIMGLLIGMLVLLFKGLDGNDFCGWCKYLTCLPVFNVCKIRDVPQD